MDDVCSTVVASREIVALTAVFAMAADIAWIDAATGGPAITARKHHACFGILFELGERKGGGGEIDQKKPRNDHMLFILRAKIVPP